MKKCFMNNMTMHNERRNPTYQAIMIDLALIGVLPKKTVEVLIDAKIPEYITLPEGVRNTLIGDEISSVHSDEAKKSTFDKLLGR